MTMSTNITWTEQFESNVNISEASVNPLAMLNAFIMSADSILTAENMPLGLVATSNSSMIKISSRICFIALE